MIIFGPSLFYFDEACNIKEGYINGPTSTTQYRDCAQLYLEEYSGVENKNLYDRWVTTLIFACFIVDCDIGLAIFGFLLFKSDGSGI